jgi:hypothetical protein
MDRNTQLCAATQQAIQAGAAFPNSSHLIEAAMRFDVEGGLRVSTSL